MLKVLLTGSSGFIGSHLYRNLKDCEIYTVTRKSHEQTGSTFYLPNGITGTTDWSLILGGVDVVIHAAAKVHDMGGQDGAVSEEYREINVRGSNNLARQAAEHGVKRFIFLSSAKVNAEKTSSSQRIKHNDDANPQDAYGQSKYEAEKELRLIANETGMEYVIVRPPLVYGAGVKANFASIVKLVSIGLPLPFGAIRHNLRSMVSVYNLSDLVGLCVSHPKAGNQIFLVTDGRDISTRELFVQVGRSLNKSVRHLPVPEFVFRLLGHLSGKSGVTDRLCDSLRLDTDHTVEQLGWRPRYSMEESLALMFAETNGNDR